jgi:hypothetical protein
VRSECGGVVKEVIRGSKRVIDRYERLGKEGGMMSGDEG